MNLSTLVHPCPLRCQNCPSTPLPLEGWTDGHGQQPVVSAAPHSAGRPRVQRVPPHLANPRRRVRPVTERWRPVVGYENHYEISDQGQVRSLDRVTVDSLGRKHPVTARILKPTP